MCIRDSLNAVQRAKTLVNVADEPGAERAYGHDQQVQQQYPYTKLARAVQWVPTSIRVLLSILLPFILFQAGATQRRVRREGRAGRIRRLCLLAI